MAAAPDIMPGGGPVQDVNPAEAIANRGPEVAGKYEHLDCRRQRMISYAAQTKAAASAG